MMMANNWQRLLSHWSRPWLTKAADHRRPITNEGCWLMKIIDC
jgi:hypothetical protein